MQSTTLIDTAGPPSVISVECDIIVGSGNGIVSDPLRPTVVSNFIETHCLLCILRWDGVVLDKFSTCPSSEVSISSGSTSDRNLGVAARVAVDRITGSVTCQDY